MKATAVNINLPKDTPVLVRGILDADPDTAKAIYGGEVVEDGRLRVVFPDCATGAVSLTVIARGFKPSDALRFTVGDSEGGSISLEPSAIPFPSNLRVWRGAFCIPNALPGIPFGDGKRIWTPAFGCYDDAWQNKIMGELKTRRYTHMPYNPEGMPYHNDYPYLSPDAARVRRDLTKLLTAGIAPVCAAVLDDDGNTKVSQCLADNADLVPITFPMWEMNGPLHSTAAINEAITNTRAAFPKSLTYIHFTAGHGAGGEPEGGWWQWAASVGVTGLLSQDDHWDDPDYAGEGLRDTSERFRNLYHTDLDNVAFELTTSKTYHEGWTETQQRAYMRTALAHAPLVVGFCDGGD